MNHQATNNEITNLTMHLMSALNGVVVNRYIYDNGRIGGIDKKIKVPLKFGGKTRQLEEAININGHVKLPIISVFMNGFNVDLNRNSAKNRNRSVTDWNGTDGYPTYNSPTPVTINYTVKIVTTKKSDFEQIISHYTSVFNPDIMISWKHPFSDEKLISKVLWDGNFAIEYPENLPATEKARNIGTMNLTLQGWIFRDNVTNVGTINCIEFNINTISEKNNIFVSEQVDDTFTIHASPEILEVSHKCIDTGRYLNVYGNNLSDIDAIFALPLSGSDFDMKTYEPFFMSETLSGEYPPFDGYMFETFDVLDTHAIAVKIPEELSSSFIDLLVFNRHSGYSKLSESLVGENCYQPYVSITNEIPLTFYTSPINDEQYEDPTGEAYSFAG